MFGELSAMLAGGEEEDSSPFAELEGLISGAEPVVTAAATGTGTPKEVDTVAVVEPIQVAAVEGLEVTAAPMSARRPSVAIYILS